MGAINRAEPVWPAVLSSEKSQFSGVFDLRERVSLLLDVTGVKFAEQGVSALVASL